MSAAFKVPPPYVRWGFRLDSVEYLEEITRRKAIAEDYFSVEFDDVRQMLDDVDQLIISVLTDLSNDEDMKDVVFEIAKIANKSFCIRGLLPWKEDEEQSSDVRATENDSTARATTAPTDDEPSRADYVEDPAEREEIRGMVTTLAGKARSQ